MSSQKIFFAENVRFLRERRKLSQEALAEKLSLTRSKLNAIENGQTKTPRSEDYISFSEFFRISIDSMLRIDLSRLGELQLRELEAGNDVYMMGSKIRVLAITVDKENRENIEYVPVKAKAGYRDGYSDPEYLAQLPRFSLPLLSEGYTYRMFPTMGDSMLPIPDGSDIIGQYVTDWTSLRPDTPCIVILKGDQDFVFKQVTIHEDGSLLLKSFNPLYEPYTVKGEEVIEIWKYHSFWSSEIPSEDTSMAQLMKMMMELQREVRELKKG